MMTDQFIKSKAAIAWGPKQPLSIEEVDVMLPRKGEVLIKVIASGVCHTDAFTLSGEDPEGIFPVILGHEGGGIVEQVGEGVTCVEVGDHVIPLYTPECGECKFCLSGKTNLCQKIRETQGKGLMPDGTTRFYKDGQPIYHYMGCSTFSEYTVLPEISLAKVNKEAPFSKAFQNSNTILLSNDAEIFAQPHLEILIDELEASHGATTGTLDREQLLYLQSRGIPEVKAYDMLLKAFESQIYDNISDTLIKEFISSYTRSKYV